MYEAINFIIGLIFLVAAGWFAYMSHVLVTEKKERQRKGLTDYYDRPFQKHNTHYRDGDNT